MKLKIYKTYILKSYLYYFLIVSLIFTLLSFFLNFLEEIVFFESLNGDVMIVYIDLQSVEMLILLVGLLFLLLGVP